MFSNGSLPTIILLILIAGLVGTDVVLWQMVRRYNRLMQGIKKKELRELLEHSLSLLNREQQETSKLRAWLERLQSEEEKHLQKVGFLRYNPFSDTGGNQSFCLAILDRHDNGVVISSLHSRDQTRVYAKDIRGGKADGQQLSKEEKEALKRAQAQD